ncbi:YceI family protein [Sinorhizobium sp. BG8]|uniref:YceI family protein n=1 Tax=Sinorhizobium sp. BG8 TaxID=2613773 RepID=UPI00193E67C7|nr:YceI family protein [Sinorhizobium sp. BG8]QRM54679.1 polyisoprenoid-binding protein [Sinorhizobium sp. BG8]
MKSVCLIGAGVLAALLSAAPMALANAPDLKDAAGTYRIANASRIGFSVDQVGGGGISGVFNKFSGTFKINSNNVSASTVNFTLFPGSVTTKDGRIADFLRSSAVFDAENFPQVTFRSTSVRQTSSDTAVVEGTLTAKGVSRRETFNVRLTDWSSGSIAFNVEGRVHRSRYKMAAGEPIYLDIVIFDMNIKGQRR